jgi:hypothetical protein
MVATLVVFAPLPLVGIGYELYRYIELEGAHQGIVTLGVLGGLVVKTLLIPVSKPLL